MAPASHLDLTTQSFLTNDDGAGHATLKLGIDGQPMRQAQDVASNDTFVQITANIPTDLSLPKAAQRAGLIDQMLVSGVLVAVAGHGVWCKLADVDTVVNTLK
jgi:hypothetical protein